MIAWLRSLFEADAGAPSARAEVDASGKTPAS